MDDAGVEKGNNVMKSSTKSFSIFACVFGLAFTPLAALAAGAGDVVTRAELEELRAAMEAQLQAQAGNVDFTWTMVAAALVFLMQGGFMLLEAGMVRSKNSINVAQKNIADFVVSTCVFFVAGFTIMFGSSVGDLCGWGGISWGEAAEWTFTFFVFQLVFCGTAATIVSGAVAERMKFSGYLIITVVIALIIYPVFGHWAWGNLLIGDNTAWLADEGFIDFAGSTVVHSVGGWVALAAILVAGPRIGRFDAAGNPQRIHGHSAVLATLGCVILWVGWLGFNAGSTTAGTPDIGHIAANTMIAGGFGGTMSLIVGRWLDGLFRPERTINGVLAGLVGITAGCDAVGAWGAMTIGLTSGVLVIVATEIMERVFKIDDVIGAVPVHGVCGAWGTMLLAFVCLEDKLAVGSRFDQFLVQAEGVAVGFAWAFFVSYGLFKLLNATVGLRVTADEEIRGLNEAEHGATLGTGMIQNALQELASGEGDITRRLDASTGDEAAEVAYAFNQLMDKLQNMLDGIGQGARRLVSSSRRLSQVGEELSIHSGSTHTRSGDASESIGVVSDNVDSMTQSIRDVDAKIASISSGAEEMTAQVSKASSEFENMADTIRSLAEIANVAGSESESAKRAVDGASSNVTELNAATDAIEKVVESINEIAHKTKVLSLNATIEAVRAGEAGKGFAVVAHEVKALAEATEHATIEIGDRVRDIKGDTSSVTDAIGEMTSVIDRMVESSRSLSNTATEQEKTVSEVRDQMHSAATHAGKITSSISEIAEKSNHVSESASRTADATHRVHSNVREVSETAQETTRTASTVNGVSEDVNRIAKELDSMVTNLGSQKSDVA